MIFTSVILRISYVVTIQSYEFIVACWVIYGQAVSYTK